MTNVRNEIRNWCRESARTSVAAIQAENASAACPEGSPPRSGVPRPVYALTAMTTSSVSVSAIKVSLAGALVRRSKSRVLRSATCPEKTRKPTATALMVATRTAPAAMSFASFAIGSKEVVATSIAPSIALLIISAISTNAIESISAISSSFETPVASASTSTATAIAKWIRMFRCVRRTWMIPSNA
jgi:hypothetical protein